MFSFFKKSKVNIQSVTIPDFGWKKIRQEAGIIMWINPEETIAVSIHFFNQPPDLPTIKNVEVMRNFYRTGVGEANGGLVQVDLTEMNNRAVLKTILKLPEGPEGVKYIATLTMPFKTCSFVFKVQTGPMPKDGMREAVVVDHLIKNGADIEKDWWVGDPYDTSAQIGLPTNKGEEEIYDSLFPAHFLSVARHLINQIEKEVKWNSEIDKLQSFER